MEVTNASVQYYSNHQWLPFTFRSNAFTQLCLKSTLTVFQLQFASTAQKTMSHLHTRKTSAKWEKTDRAWFSCLLQHSSFDIRPRNGAGLFFQPRSPHGAHWWCQEGPLSDQNCSRAPQKSNLWAGLIWCLVPKEWVTLKSPIFSPFCIVISNRNGTSSSFLACNSRLCSAVSRPHPPQRPVLGHIQFLGWRFSVAVTRWSWST